MRCGVKVEDGSIYPYPVLRARARGTSSGPSKKTVVLSVDLSVNYRLEDELFFSVAVYMYSQN